MWTAMVGVEGLVWTLLGPFAKGRDRRHAGRGLNCYVRAVHMELTYLCMPACIPTKVGLDAYLQGLQPRHTNFLSSFSL